MPRRHSPDNNDATSRKRTASMLRRLRELSREFRMLRTNIETARTEELEPRLRRGRSNHR
jgi:hypothetical protein